jgi:uncharacterized protein YmfQ (DUF2313 family)
MRANPTNPDAALTPAEFTTDLSMLMPPGNAFGFQTLALLSGIGQCFGDFHADLAQVSEVETIPSTAESWLPSWLKDWGLPDQCMPAAATPAESTDMLLAKIAAIGGQSEDYYIGVAAAMGYTITVSFFTPLRFGQPFGTPFYDEKYVFVWKVHAPGFTRSFLKCGQAFGLPFSSWTGTPLQCVLRGIQPSHTLLLFNYEIV